MLIFGSKTLEVTDFVNVEPLYDIFTSPQNCC